jgi:H/ACA ribonucleoprotein complex subunit 4
MPKSKSTSGFDVSSLPSELRERLYCSFVVIDKPRGPSSHEVAAWVRKILGVEKSGHAGTLDPNVSGILIVGIGKATRLLPYVTTKDKKYVCLMRTGKEMTGREYLSLFMKFTGEITQTPPKMSAVAKRPRKRKVYYIKPLQLKPKEALFEVHCEAGTYIRVIVSEMGAFTGGAEMLELRRIAVGAITEEKCFTLQSLSDAFWAARQGDGSALTRMLLPPQEALSLRKVVLRGAAVDAVAAGAPLYAPGLSSIEDGVAPGDPVVFTADDGRFVGVGRASVGSEDARKMKTGAVAKPEATVLPKVSLLLKENVRS